MGNLPCENGRNLWFTKVCRVDWFSPLDHLPLSPQESGLGICIHVIKCAERCCLLFYAPSPVYVRALDIVLSSTKNKHLQKAKSKNKPNAVKKQTPLSILFAPPKKENPKKRKSSTQISVHSESR